VSHFPLPLHPFRPSSGDIKAIPVDFGFKTIFIAGKAAEAGR
jgi:hypothetical protein